MRCALYHILIKKGVKSHVVWNSHYVGYVVGSDCVGCVRNEEDKGKNRTMLSAADPHVPETHQA